MAHACTLHAQVGRFKLWLFTTSGRDMGVSVSHVLYPRLSLMLKSVIALSRTTPTYRLSRQQEDELKFTWVVPPPCFYHDLFHKLTILYLKQLMMFYSDASHVQVVSHVFSLPAHCRYRVYTGSPEVPNFDQGTLAGAYKTTTVDSLHCNEASFQASNFERGKVL